ncbi:MAG: type VI secretion system contractile sheath large subunit [Pseudomonadota bacterium]|nr:type VI secretion system contractile sheath large subunit [Pseudomonadota bacterium]
MDNADWSPDFGYVSTALPNWATKRPQRIAILGDFGAGALSGRLDSGPELARRKPLKVEFDTLDDALARLALTLRLPIGPEQTAVTLEIAELEAFHPDEIYRNLELFAALASLRKRLNQPASFAAAAAEVMKWADVPKISAGALAVRQRSRGSSLRAGSSLDDFARLTGRAASSAAADEPVDRLLRRVVGPFVVPAASPNKDALVAAVDQALSDLMRAVLHQPEFQNAESLWRGVDFLLRRLETGPQLQVHLFDVSAEEFAADLSANADLSESGLYAMLAGKPSEDADGGYTWIAGCYEFAATPPHAELLGRMAQVAAAANAPFLTAIATDAFTDRKEPPHRLVAAAFQALRSMPAASFLGLVGPSFLLRHPYGKRSDPIASFGFEEFSRSSGLRGMLWGHPALLALSVLGVRGGQLTIGDLPFHHYVDAGGDSVALPCTDRLINTQGSALLRDFGINAVMAHKGEPLVRLAGLEAVNGDGLAAAPAGKPVARSGARVLVQGKLDARPQVVASWAPGTRSQTAGPATAPPAAAPATAEATQDSATPADAQVDDEALLAALAAGAGTADAALAAGAAAGETAAAPAAEASAEAAAAAEAAATEEAPADGGTGDPELDALLASLESADAPAADSAAAPAAAEDDGMDPELAALLKSLG